MAGAAISEREQMAVGARHSWTKLQFVCASEQADSAVIGSAKGRDERPLTGDHLGNVTGDFWPISDRLFARNRSFRSKLSNLTVTVWPMPANEQKRP